MKLHCKTGDVNKETVNWHHIYSLNKLLYSKMSHDVRYKKDEKVSGEYGIIQERYNMNDGVDFISFY